MSKYKDVTKIKDISTSEYKDIDWCNKILAIERKYELAYLITLLTHFLDIDTEEHKKNIESLENHKDNMGLCPQSAFLTKDPDSLEIIQSALTRRDIEISEITIDVNLATEAIKNFIDADILSDLINKIKLHLARYIFKDRGELSRRLKEMLPSAYQDH